MGNNHSRSVRKEIKGSRSTPDPGRSTVQGAYQQRSTFNAAAAGSRRHDTSESSTSHRSKVGTPHAQRHRTTRTHNIYRDIATVTTILSRYANWYAIEKVLQERLGPSSIVGPDGMRTQHWRIETTQDDVKRVHAIRELTKEEQEEIYGETHRRRREGIPFHGGVRAPEYT